MLGRHPQLYGLPDVNLFVADTIEGWYVHLTQHRQRPQNTHGLLRVLAQLHEEEQTEQSINRAWDWLAARKTWTTASLWSYLSKLVYPRVLVDKSPSTVRSEENMQRALEAIPGGNFIHLTRHPVASSQSLDSLREKMQRYGATENDEADNQRDNALLFWHKSHNTIVNFVAGLAEGQSLRVSSEQLLADPVTYLSQISQWLGLEHSEMTLDAMLHPEYSPYACLGPINAQYGDDRDFLMSPTTKPTLTETAALADYSSFQEAPEAGRPKIMQLALQLGYQ